MCGHRQVQISSLNLLITVQYQNKCSTVSSSLLQNVHREEFILHIFMKKIVATIPFSIYIENFYSLNLLMT